MQEGLQVQMHSSVTLCASAVWTYDMVSHASVLSHRQDESGKVLQDADLNLIGPTAALLGKVPAPLAVLVGFCFSSSLPCIQDGLTGLIHFSQLLHTMLHGLELLCHGGSSLQQGANSAVSVPCGFKPGDSGRHVMPLLVNKSLSRKEHDKRLFMRS